MATSIPVQDTPSTNAEVAAHDATKPPTRPIDRLLSQVSKTVGVYADYQMEAGIWRKLSL